MGRGRDGEDENTVVLIADFAVEIYSKIFVMIIKIAPKCKKSFFISSMQVPKTVDFSAVKQNSWYQ